MENTIEIKFDNKLLIEKRDLNIYHRKNKGTHLISYGSSVKIPLQIMSEGDYVNLSVAVGPGYMERQNTVELPYWLNYEVLSEGRIGATHTGGRIRLKFPAGLPEWTLKLSLSKSHNEHSEGRVVISDENEQ